MSDPYAGIAAPDPYDNIAKEEPRGNSKDNRPTSFWQGFGEALEPYAANAQRAMDYVNPLNIVARTAINAVAPKGRGPLLPSPKQQVQQRKRQMANAPYQGSTAGRIAGSVVGSLPTLAVPGGALVQGGVAGAMGTEDPTNPRELATNVAIGAAAGKAGEVAGKTLGRVVRGNPNPSVKALADEGVVMTPGMRGGPGSVAQFMEDKVMGSVWPLNVVAEAAKDRANNGLRVAVANRVLGPIGETIPRKTRVNQSVIAGVQEKVHNAYNRALTNMSLAPEQTLFDELDNISLSSVRVAGPDGAQQVESNIKYLKDRLASGALTGKQLRETISELRAVASKNAGSGVGDQLWAVDKAIATALERQNGGAALKSYTNARAAESLLKRMEDAASRAGVKEGQFGPSQLKQAVQRRGYGTSSANVATGKAPMQDLSDAADVVMRNSTANSGTPGRLFAVSSIADPLAAAAIYANPKTAIPLGASMLGYVPGLDEVLQYAALNRPQVLQRAGTAIQNTSPYLSGPVAGGTVGLLGQ